MLFALLEGRIFTGETFLDNHAVIIENGVISSLLTNDQIPDSISRHSLQGNLLAPGFIDVQVNGGAGVLFNDAATVDTIKTIAQTHRRFGTTSLLPTLISADWDTMVAAYHAYQQAVKAKIPGVIGIHFEGPYLNPVRKGVHDEHVIRPWEEAALQLFNTDQNGRILLTVAPETLPKGVIRELSDAGIIVSAGHTAASYQQIQHALDEGLRGFTHLFNAMTPFNSRAPGVVGAALDDANSWCGIIVDGHHVHPASLRVALQAKTCGKMMLVTDAMPSVGAADKRFVLNGETITSQHGRCATADGTLAGSDLDMASALRNSVRWLNVSLAEALRMAALYPAQFLMLDDQLGRIAPGYRANLVLLDNDLNVVNSWIDGRI